MIQLLHPFFRGDSPIRQLVFDMLFADGLIMHMDLWLHLMQNNV